MIQVTSRYTYLGHDHDLVAWEAKLFDSLSENDFGMTIGIDLTISPKCKHIKSRNGVG